MTKTYIPGFDFLSSANGLYIFLIKNNIDAAIDVKTTIQSNKFHGAIHNIHDTINGVNEYP